MGHYLKSFRVVVAVPTALLLLTSAVEAQDANRVTVPFSDPSRPGTVKVNQFQGSIRVTATNGREVIVSTDDTIVTTRQGREVTVPEKPEVAGLRRLTQRSGLRIEEENNVISIGSGRFMNGEDVRIQVPARTNLNLSAFNDEITVEGIEGVIEVNSMNGEITLTNVAGSVVAHATNGDVRVTLRQVTADKPMSFTSLNGNVDVTLPPPTKANLKMRSDRGEIYTDFDVQIQQQRPSAAVARPVAPAPPLPPLPPLPAPDPNDPKGTERDARERERQARERERQARERERQAQQRANVRFEIDSGIYGAVNGGGPEFELRTFNGDIFLRRAK
jgi:DUF4097 and DUF4098 domain-containing protein YvlB